MSNGHRLTMTASSSRTTFLKKVCQLVSTMASPKHPQSLMGLAMASHSVSGVMTSIISSASIAISRLRMAKSRQMPTVNSKADSRTETPRVIRPEK